MQSGVVELPFGKVSLHSEIPGATLTAEDKLSLKSNYLEALIAVLPCINSFPIHVYLPLPSDNDPFCHVSFQGRFDFEQIIPFLNKTPNAITVVDGRPWGYLRVRLFRLEGDHIERLAEIEIYLDGRDGEYGFELFWGRSERPIRVSCYDKKMKVCGLVEEWGQKFRLLRIYPEFDRIPVF
ncbi:MAG TPA: hypothetical protein DD435_10605 [Cyanobacteria bacterium UBA8530]|nr:hypothetical protein [Cyanobacteria bacterium UBA8530]